MTKKQNGFQLIEILTTLTIISILVALTLPLYTQYLVQAKRLQAKTTLTKLAAAMEKFYMAHDTYNGATLATLNFSEPNTEKNYQLKIETDNHDYTLIAMAIGKQAENDNTCRELILAANNKHGTEGDGKDCW